MQPGDQGGQDVRQDFELQLTVCSHEYSGIECHSLPPRGTLRQLLMQVCGMTA